VDVGNNKEGAATSPLKEAYLLLGAKTPLELSDLYSAEDQKLMKAGAWDYDNPNLIVNKVKTNLEFTDLATLSEEEKEWRKEILWFWYHHAISCAIWRYKDKQAAQAYSARALELQSDDHPNQITRLLYLLVRDQLPEAEAWAMTVNEEEKDTAESLIKQYKGGGFYTDEVARA
jgi:hypothetical protein